MGAYKSFLEAARVFVASPFLPAVLCAAFVMHRALQIREVVDAIIRELNDSRLISELVTFACTCRAFCEPALDVLWASPPNGKLARQMPEDLWIIAHAPAPDGSMHGSKRVLVRPVRAPCANAA
jgi:hypothetical protein